MSEGLSFEMDPCYLIVRNVVLDGFSLIGLYLVALSECVLVFLEI